MKIVLSILTLFTLSSGVFAQQKLDPDYLREKGITNLFPFYHGVASGDPLSDAVILWTRVTDDTLTRDSVAINWRIATDTLLNNVVNSGTGYAAASRDWTFKVDATGLQPDTWYYYDFEYEGYNSITGRTHTAPVGDIDSLRFGIVTCSNYEHGYFSPYRYLENRNDIDCILHLGDYIYEYEVGGFSANIAGRTNEPTNEIITLEDYRIRHSHYKLDADLRELHQQYPFINIWDDHESANDSYKDGAANHDPATEGSWTDRKSNSAQAYFEWLPIRPPVAGQPRIYREFAFGDLINLPMIDSRIEARDLQISNTTDAMDPARTMLGATQFDWLTNNLKTSTKQWNILGNQVMMAPLEIFGTPANYDQWDGYAYERGRLLDSVVMNNVNNFVVLTGDIHTSWVNDIPMSNYDGGTCTGSAGVEFVVTSVTSTSFLTFTIPTSFIQSLNPHMQYIDLTKRGYGILDVNKQRAQFDYYYMDDIEDPNSGQYYATSYFVNSGEKCANQASGASSRPGPGPFYAPDPVALDASVAENNRQTFIVMGAYPNPTNENVTFQMYAEKVAPINIQVFDLQGRLVYQNNMNNVHVGVNYAQLDISSLENGTYQFVISSGVYRVTKSIVKY